MQNQKTRIVIIGAGGFGCEVLETIRDCNKISDQYDVIGFLDDDKSLWNRIIFDVKVLGGIEWILKNKDDIKCIVAIADNHIRKKIVTKLKKENVSFEKIIHPSVICSSTTKLGEGSIIQAGCIITVGISIGDHVHINIGSTIGHYSILKNFVTLSPGVHINGNIIINEGVFVGTGAVFKNNINVGEWSKIGAGTILLDDADAFGLYVGMPGKLKKMIKNSN